MDQKILARAQLILESAYPDSIELDSKESVILRTLLQLSIAIAESLVQIEYHTNLLCKVGEHNGRN